MSTRPIITRGSGPTSFLPYPATAEATDKHIEGLPVGADTLLYLGLWSFRNRSGGVGWGKGNKKDILALSTKTMEDERDNESGQNLLVVP